MMIHELIPRIVDELQTEVIERALEVGVTDDPHEAAAILAAGGDVMLVHAAPALEFQTHVRYVATWTIWAIAGSSRNPSAAMSALSEAIDAARDAVPLDNATPNTYEFGSATFPGYELTFTTEHP